MMRFVFFMAALWWACPALAANIVAAPVGARETGAIIVSGTLQPGDDEVFAKRLMQFPKGIVVFQGDGGDLQTAIAIGTAIRLKNYATLVPTETSCASACAVAWLGGAPRLMEDGSQIGFHAAYAVKNGQTREAGVPNALLGAYLAKIGLPDRAVVYITEAPPDDVKWLSRSDAAEMGIEVKTIARSETPAVASTTPDAPVLAAPAQDRRVRIHLKKRNAYFRRKDNKYFVSWMMATLRRLGASPSSRLIAKDNASRTR
jgi:hypothetical protein